LAARDRPCVDGEKQGGTLNYAAWGLAATLALMSGTASDGGDARHWTGAAAVAASRQYGTFLQLNT
jgi:hypothetical protein